MGKYKLENVCDICGEPKGYPFDHQACAEERKKTYRDSGENKHPLKKYSKKTAKTAADYFSKRYS